MAFPYTTIDAITDALYLPGITQHFADEDVIVKNLWKGGTKAQGGERAKMPLFYQFTKGGFYADFDTFDIDGEEHITAAYLDWSLLNVPLVISRLEQIQNSGPTAIHNYMEELSKHAMVRISDLLADAVFGTGIDSDNEINGLRNVIDDDAGGSAGTLSSSSTYANIDRAEASWWEGKVYDTSTGSETDPDVPTYNNLSPMLELAYDGSKRIDQVYCGPRFFHRFLRSQQDQQRYVTRRDAETGFLSAAIDTATLFVDKHVTETTGDSDLNLVYGINSKFIDLVSHRDENMRREKWAKPVDQNIMVSHIFWAGVLASNDPSRHAISYGWDLT